MSRADDVELVIEPQDSRLQYRTPLARALTTIGADASAQLHIPGVPDRWAVVQRQGASVQLRLMGGGPTIELAVGETVVQDGVRVSLASTASSVGMMIQPLAERLSNADSPEDALRGMLEGLLAATSAESGAVILSEAGEYRVAVACQNAGAEPLDGQLLLSDHVVRDVLGEGKTVFLDDTTQHARYATVPSVTAMRLRSILCAPMRLRQLVIGAIFLGTRDLTRPLTARQAADVGLLASMAVPLLVQLRRIRPGTGPADSIIFGESEAIQTVRNLVTRVGTSTLSVLILGETGVGKELVARALHAASPRAQCPMVAINCSAVARTLLESELFGHRRGTFTGALSDRKGRIEQAEGSTLFLDEVGDMPLAMQAALLHVLESRTITRLGENDPRAVDFRLVAATHRDLDAEVAAGRFRRDLLYRLAEFTIHVPPLRERPDDILLLAALFLRQIEKELGIRDRRLSREAAAALLDHAWPGNVRELRATMRRAAVLADGLEIRLAHLALGPRSHDAPQPETSVPVSVPLPASAPGPGDLTRPLVEARDQFIKSYVSAAIARAGGDREAAARALGISVRSLYRHQGR